MKFVLIIFFLFSALHFGFALHLPESIPQHDFPYRDILVTLFSSGPFTPFANADGIHYLLIAKNGYEEFQQSYFPLFPWFISLAMPLFAHNFVYAGVVVSWTFFLLGLGYFYKLSSVLLQSLSRGKWAVLLLAAFPTAFFYQVVYADSLLLFLSAAALYYLYTKKFLLAALFAVAASITKIQGVFLLLPFLVVMLDLKNFSPKEAWLQLKKQYRHLLLAFAPLYGLAGYMVYLFFKHNDPLYFYHSQSAFGAERSVDKFILLPQVFYRYFKIFLTYPMNFTYWISVLEFVVCLAFLGVIGYEIYRLVRQKKKDMQQLSLQVYSLVILILPTLTGTLTSLPRYALISFGFFVALANIRQSIVKSLLVVLFLVFHVVLFLFFLKGYFVS